mmetsp:Transcript_14112/g.36046  ORF Transcript_14112/g.36046 Transcript_14112/m.36046 type:complete len:200 (+) Transcript_14112:888-1487(+)
MGSPNTFFCCRALESSSSFMTDFLLRKNMLAATRGVAHGTAHSRWRSSLSCEREITWQAHTVPHSRAHTATLTRTLPSPTWLPRHRAPRSAEVPVKQSHTTPRCTPAANPPPGRHGSPPLWQAECRRCESHAGHKAKGTPHKAQGTPHKALLTGHKALLTGHKALLTGHKALFTGHTALFTRHSSTKALLMKAVHVAKL